MKMNDNTPSLRRNRVSFANQVSIKTITHVNDMSTRRLRCTYMTRDEHDKIHRECEVLVTMIQLGHSMSFCERGLRQHTEGYIERADATRENALRMVHAVQKHQKVTGQDGSEFLAKLLTKLTEGSVERARDQALSDEKEANPTDARRYSSRRTAKNLLSTMYEQEDIRIGNKHPQGMSNIVCSDTVVFLSIDPIDSDHSESVGVVGDE